MNVVAPFTLTGRHVRLDPLTRDHVGALVEATSESRATYGLTLVPDGEEAMRAWVDLSLTQREQGLVVPFATCDLARGRVVGTTRFMTIERWTWPLAVPEPLPSAPFDAAEIGATWLAASAQRTPINTEAKLLMLEHAFDVWHLRRISLKTDARNVRSRNAIARIGCRFDGVLRGHSPAFDGGVRDTAFFSMLPAEWPEAKLALQARLARND